MTKSDARLEHWMRKALESYLQNHPHEEDLDGLVRGDLDQAREEEVRVHLDRCTECAEVVEELTRLADAESAPPVEVPEEKIDEAWQGLRERLAQTEDWPESRPEPGAETSPPGQFRAMGWRAAVAASLLIALGAVVWAMSLARSVDKLRAELNQKQDTAAVATRELERRQEELTDAREALSEIFQRWRREAAPEPNVPILTLSAGSLSRGARQEARREIDVPADVRRFVVVLEDPSATIHDTYKLKVTAAGEEKILTLDRTRYGNFVASLSRGSFPEAEQLELELVGIDEGVETTEGRYVLNLR